MFVFKLDVRIGIEKSKQIISLGLALKLGGIKKLTYARKHP